VELGVPIRQPYSYSVRSPNKLFKNSSTTGAILIFEKLGYLFFSLPLCRICVCPLFSEKEFTGM
jgi:hypothetical protein